MTSWHLPLIAKGPHTPTTLPLRINNLQKVQHNVKKLLTTHFRVLIFSHLAILISIAFESSMNTSLKLWKTTKKLRLSTYFSPLKRISNVIKYINQHKTHLSKYEFKKFRIEVYKHTRLRQLGAGTPVLRVKVDVPSWKTTVKVSNIWNFFLENSIWTYGVACGHRTN